MMESAFRKENSIKVIKTEDQYHLYLNEVHQLMVEMPALNTPQSERLELLTVILEDYENKKPPVEAPDPIDAIKFRMEELGLKQIDLVPYLGSRSRVSEVLSGKRPLTVQMIRELTNHLGISSDTLLGVNAKEESKKTFIDCSKFPVKEMMKRGWLKKLTNKAFDVENIVLSYIDSAGLNFENTAFKRTLKGDGVSPATQYSLYAWLARITLTSRENKHKLGVFDPSFLTADFFHDLAQLSWFEKGPLLAIEFLEKHGIAVIIEPALKGTLLDGAALKDVDGTPIIGLTIRFDRLDSFWFTLLHELAHIWKHVSTNDAFFDDFKVASCNQYEAEANRIAQDSFIPRSIWKRSDAYLKPTKENIDMLARQLKIHPAIIAGRVRKEKGYDQLVDFVGQGDVRKIFEINGITWG
jgi:Predicted transcription regulator containing HTH domain